MEQKINPEAFYSLFFNNNRKGAIYFENVSLKKKSVLSAGTVTK